MNSIVCDVWAIVTERNLKSDDVLDCLTEMFIRHGAPEYIRSHNEFIYVKDEVCRWLSNIGRSDPLTLKPAVLGKMVILKVSFMTS